MLYLHPIIRLRKYAVSSGYLVSTEVGKLD